MLILSDEEMSALENEADKELARRFYRDYVEYVHHGHYEHYQHTELICDVLQRVADGEQLSILIEMPHDMVKV